MEYAQLQAATQALFWSETLGFQCRHLGCLASGGLGTGRELVLRWGAYSFRKYFFTPILQKYQIQDGSLICKCTLTRPQYAWIAGYRLLFRKGAGDSRQSGQQRSVLKTEINAFYCYYYFFKCTLKETLTWRFAETKILYFIPFSIPDLFRTSQPSCLSSCS